MSVTQLCPTLVTPWIVALQAPLSMGFFRQEYWSGLPCLLQGVFPDQGSNPSVSAPVLQADSLLLIYWGCPLMNISLSKYPADYQMGGGVLGIYDI